MEHIDSVAPMLTPGTTPFHWSNLLTRRWSDDTADWCGCSLPGRLANDQQSWRRIVDPDL